MNKLLAWLRSKFADRKTYSAARQSVDVSRNINIEAMELSTNNERNFALNQLKASAFVALQAALFKEGFRINSKGDALVRPHGSERSDYFQPVFIEAPVGWRVQPHVGVRIEKVEMIFHRSSKFAEKYQGDTVTMGTAVGLLYGKAVNSIEFLLRSEDDISHFINQLLAIFQEFATPYFVHFGSIAAIDHELNANPERLNIHRLMPWLRCSTGAIVARLVGRSDYEEVVKLYQHLVKVTDKGFYLKRFENLIESLKAI